MASSPKILKIQPTGDRIRVDVDINVDDADATQGGATFAVFISDAGAMSLDQISQMAIAKAEEMARALGV